MSRRIALSLIALALACAANKPAPEAPPAQPAAAAPATAQAAAPSRPADALLPGEDVLAARPSVPPLPAFEAPVPQQFTLPNGLRVLVIEKAGAPIESVQLVVRHGGTSDPADKTGLSSLTAAMLEVGSAGRSQAAIAAEADALGASLRAGATQDATVVSISGLGVRVNEMVALLADVALRPDFDAKEWAKVKSQRLATLRLQKAEPGAAAALAFAAAIYGKHPLGRPASGTPESVAALELKDAKQAFASWSPKEAAFAVAGGVKAAQVVAALTASFGGWKERAAKPGAKAARPDVRKAKPVVPPPDVAPSAFPAPPAGERPRLVLVDFPGRPQSVVQVGEPSVPRSSPDVMALRLLDAVLGGSFTSRLNQNLREEHGYTYGAGSQFAFGAGPGAFVAGSSVKTDVTAPALKEMLSELHRAFTEPLLPEELAKGKALLAFDLVSTLEHADAAAGAAAGIYLYDLPADEFRTFVPRLTALDPQAVLAAGKRAVDPAAFTVTIAGDAKAVLLQLETAGLGLGAPQLRDAEGKLTAPK